MLALLGAKLGDNPSRDQRIEGILISAKDTLESPQPVRICEESLPAFDAINRFSGGYATWGYVVQAARPRFGFNHRKASTPPRTVTTAQSR